MLAMLCFASMDAISKLLVADYAVGQMMWIRYGLLFLFAWFVVRKQGLRAALRSQRPWLQICVRWSRSSRARCSCWPSATCRSPTRTRSPRPRR